MMKKVVIERLGTIDLDIVEATPVVFRGKLYRFEYIRTQYYGNTTGDSYFRFVDAATGETGVSFGHGLHMGSAFVWEDRIFVSCVEDWGKSRFYMLESSDMLHWSTPRLILSDPAWQGYNTSICRADEKFVMVFELGAPLEPGDEVFTMFFAESKDLQNWAVMPGKSYGKGVYCGAPMLRFFDGYYYFFHLSGSYETGFDTYVSRSRDLEHWSDEKLIFRHDDCDRKINFNATPEQLLRIEKAVNINISDLDICEFDGKTHLVFSWGAQRGNEFLATGLAHCSEKTFCEFSFEPE